MSKVPKKGTKQSLARQVAANPPSLADFDEVVRLIDAARTRAVAAVNTTLIELYWSIGEYISRKIESAAWGEGVVEQLAAHIARTHPGLRGYTRPNLFRMRQFYETYRGDEKVSALLTQLPWFLDLPPGHSEADLQRGLVEQLKNFLIELGRDFCYVGSQYPVQVGG